MKSNHAQDQSQPLSIRQIFEGGTYRVPLYQRAYAWTTDEIQTLLVDIQDARRNGQAGGALGEVRDYYLGSLVVNTVRSDDRVIYEVVDGQQRLTTLFILVAVASGILGEDRPYWAGALNGKLVFEGRDGARNDLHRLARDGSQAIDRLTTDGIKQAAELVKKAASQSFSAGDLGYLLDHVKILRTELPSGTDLNHYFEVMNTRGEQLEKHEILKSRLLSVLKTEVERNTFSQIWDACAVLDRHVQTQFSSKNVPGGRTRIFGDQWDGFIPQYGSDLFAEFDQVESSPSGPPVVGKRDRVALSEVLFTFSDDQSDHAAYGSGDETSSYGAIIDFPNLLLHVLKIKQRETFSWTNQDDRGEGQVRLEDKYLLAEFDKAKPSMDESWVREFAHLLLKTRYLMDTYIIRTLRSTAGDDEENWVIHRAFRYVPSKGSPSLSARATFGTPSGHDWTADDSLRRRALMLQAMFQVTDSRRASKYFLFQALQWLHLQDDPSRISEAAFVELLESSARERLRSLDFLTVLHQGTQVPNFLFNVLDYELWRIGADSGAAGTKGLLDPSYVATLQGAAGAFRFRYRTSVEHFYPATPSAEQGHAQLPNSISNHFGNLCIMSRSENSRRNNLMPKAKAVEFASTGQSLKFQLMAGVALGEAEWGPNQITAHGYAMEAVLRNVLTGALTRLSAEAV